MKYQILQGDNRDTLKTLADNSIDAIVTDPPYGIDFLGKAWDANTGALETYQECLRVLKPGGHILAFSAARTYHHLAVTLEQAGFEIRDQIMWIYSSGFPKSQDIGKSIQRSLGVKEKKTIKSTSAQNTSKEYTFTEGVKEYDKEYDVAICTDPEALQWEGWGTSLKPAHEPIALARKPIKLSIAKNAQQWGTGALNIDATRVETTDKIQSHFNRNSGAPEFAGEEKNIVEVDLTISDKGRFPSNVIGEILQADYQKYFYCPKVSRKERHIGFEDLPKRLCGPGGDDFVQAQDHQRSNENTGNNQGVISNDEMLAKMGGHFINEVGNKKATQDGSMLWLPHTGNIYIHGLKHEYQKWCKANGIELGNVGNNHPTVKPIELMKYLIKLITPPGGVVLDPFNGSGSTGCAAVELGFEYIGCELDPAYVEITKKRIEAWNKSDNNFEELFIAA